MGVGGTVWEIGGFSPTKCPQLDILHCYFNGFVCHHSYLCGCWKSLLAGNFFFVWKVDPTQRQMGSDISFQLEVYKLSVNSCWNKCGWKFSFIGNSLDEHTWSHCLQTRRPSVLLLSTPSLVGQAWGHKMPQSASSGSSVPQHCPQMLNAPLTTGKLQMFVSYFNPSSYWRIKKHIKYINENFTEGV